MCDDVIKIGNIYRHQGGNFDGSVFDPKGIAPTLIVGGGVIRVILCDDHPLIYDRYNKRFIKGEACGCIATHPQDGHSGTFYFFERRGMRIAIRKLIPKETWRLMDFDDEDFEKASATNSDSQLFKQSGNSICVNVLCAIFGQMLPGKEDYYRKEATDERND